MSPEAIMAAKLFGYKAIHGLIDGERIETAPVVGYDGEYILLMNGHKVKLGEPKPSYVQFCKDVGCHVPTKEEPFATMDHLTREEWEERQAAIAKARKEKGI
jgi:hypothetical protein